jgi:hypothetical protein
MQSFPIIKFLYSNLYSDSKKGNMETIHEVITRLKFISLIKKGEKICVKSLSVQQTSIMTSFLRMFHKESRETTLDFLTSTINRVFEIIQLCLSSNKISDKTLCKNLVNDLINSSVGLENLQTTYSDDRLFWCHINTLIQAIECKLNDLKESHSDLFIQINLKNIIDNQSIVEDEIKFS